MGRVLQIFFSQLASLNFNPEGENEKKRYFSTSFSRHHDFFLSLRKTSTREKEEEAEMGKKYSWQFLALFSGEVEKSTVKKTASCYLRIANLFVLLVIILFPQV